MPTSQCSTSPRWMTPLSPQNGDSAAHGVPADWRSTSRQEPRRQAQVGEPLADVPRHVVGRRHARRDDALRERLGDHAARDRDHVRVEIQLKRRARLEPADAQASRRWPYARPRLGPERVHQRIAQPAGEAVAERPLAAGVDADPLRLALGDDLGQPLPLARFGAALSTPPCSRPSDSGSPSGSRAAGPRRGRRTPASTAAARGTPAPARATDRRGPRRTRG